MSRQRFGQHFLTNRTIIARLIAAIDPRPEQHFIEIGPGKGALTLPLLPYVKHLDAVEIDTALLPWLTALAEENTKFSIHHSDALQFDFASLTQHITDTTQRKARLVGNLPYQISTPLLFHLHNTLDTLQDMHFMLQKEVVNRLTAAPGSRQYGRLSVMSQLYYRSQHLFDVPAGAFSPPPKVTSAIVRLTPHSLIAQVNELSHFSQLVKYAFCQRRKTLGNSLKNWIPKTHWSNLNIDPKRRPETLSVEEFIYLANHSFLLS